MENRQRPTHADAPLHAQQRQRVKTDAAMNSRTSQCCICAEIVTGEFPLNYRHAYPIDSRICLETKDFVVFPSVSPMSGGHVLLLPRVHVTRLADLPDGQCQQLRLCVDQATDRLRERFGQTCYLFEHGVATGGTACGIDHAHLHLLPLATNIAYSIEAQVEADFPTSGLSVRSIYHD
ncbi:MAG: HIT domain-containing protein [Acidobacteriia bacterium]|nr:HIT domain-containing protein [Terriglobia bacterium]